MKKFFHRLVCLCIASFALGNAQAQYAIYNNGTGGTLVNSSPSSPTPICGDGSAVAWVLKNGSTIINSSTITWYCSSFSLIGTTNGLYTINSSCTGGPVANVYKLSSSVGAVSNGGVGDVTLYALSNTTGCILATAYLRIYPFNVGLVGTLTGPSAVGASAQYSLTAVSPWTTGATGMAWSFLSGASGYNITGGQGTNTVTVAPNAYTPLNMNMYLKCAFTPGGSPCGNVASETINVPRTPVITSSGAVCSAKNITVNCASYTGSGTPPVLGTGIYRPKFTYTWYQNGVSLGTSSNQTLTGAVPADYYVVVTQYDWNTSTNSYNTVATLSKPSNTITIVTDTDPAVLNLVVHAKAIPGSGATDQYYGQAGYPPLRNDIKTDNIVGLSGTEFIFPNSTAGAGTTICSLAASVEKYIIALPTSHWQTVGTVVLESNCTALQPSGFQGSYPITLLADASHVPFINGVGTWRINFTLQNNCGYHLISEVIGIDASKYQRIAQPGGLSNETGDAYGSILFSPVPFSGTVHLSLTAAEAGTASLDILSVDGRLVAQPLKNVSISEGSFTQDIATDNWPAGIYFYRSTINGHIYSGKLVKN